MAVPLDIVVVDDDAAVLELLSLVLLDAGHVVRAASDAHRALQLLGERPTGVLVTDVVMEPIDGVALARMARERWPHLPIVFISAYTPEHLGVLSDRDGTWFVSKPFLAEELLGAVNRAVAAPRR